jgi:hypothetical protein
MTIELEQRYITSGEILFLFSQISFGVFKEEISARIIL